MADRRRRHHPGDHRRAQGRRRRVPGVPGGDGRRHCSPGPYKIPRLGFSMSMVWTNTMGKGAYRGPVDVRDDGARDGDRLRRARDRDRSRRVPAQEPARRRRPAVHLAGRQGVHRDHAARDARAGARDARLRGVPQGAGGGARRGPAARPRAQRLRRAHVDGRRRRCTPRAPPCASSRAARWWRSSARRRTARASRRRWRRSSPTRSASTTTTSPSCRPTRSPRRTGPGTGGSRTAVIAGGAARAATVAVRDKVLAIAAHMMEASPDDLEIADSVGVGAGHADASRSR